MIKEVTEILLKRENLNRAQTEAVMEEIMNGKASTDEIVSFLSAMSSKGETIEELTAAATVMRRHSKKINTKHKVILDTCGTGGDRKGTFNISTLVAFIVCGCGVTVAKHGNRSVSSRSGSADILEALGINIDLTEEKIEKCLDDIGIAFLFAQKLHPAMRFAAAARKQLGKSTVFNLLGPLSNPASATHQLVGVYDARWTEPLAAVLANLGSLHSLVVHGRDGLDEVTTSAETLITEQQGSQLKTYEINPEEFGLKRSSLDELAGGDASFNARIFLDILNGAGGPKRDIVLLNAACALYASDKVNSIRDGIAAASESLDSRKALEKFQQLKDCSR